MGILGLSRRKEGGAFADRWTGPQTQARRSTEKLLITKIRLMLLLAFVAKLASAQGLFTWGVTSIRVGGDAGVASVELRSNSGPRPWTAASNASWLQIATGSTSGAGNATIHFSYEANPNSSSRTGTLTVDGYALTVTQLPAGFVTGYSSPVSVISGLNAPFGLAIDSKGDLFVSQKSGVVSELPAGSQNLQTAVSGLNNPAGLAFDSSGVLYIADSNSNSLDRWSPAFGLQPLATALYDPLGVAVDGYNILIADSADSAIQQYSLNTGSTTLLLGNDLNQPSGVSVDLLGNVYIADTVDSAVKIFNPSTQQLTALPFSGLSRPVGITTDGQGNVYTTDLQNGAIYLLTAADQQVNLLASGLSQPAAVARDAQGDIFFTEQAGNDVKELLVASGWPSTKIEAPGAGMDALSYAPANVPVKASSDQPWLTVSAAAQGQIGFSFEANPLPTARVAHISAITQQFTITQEPLASGSIVPIAGNNQSTVVGQPFVSPLEVQVLDSNGTPIPDFPVVFQVVPGTASGIFTLSNTSSLTCFTDNSGIAEAFFLAANSVPGQFSVTASAGALSASFQLTTVAQKFTLGSSSLTENSAAGSDSVLLQAQPSTAIWTANANAPWLHLSTSGIGPTSVQFHYDANTTQAPRTGTLTIAGQTLSVTQAAANALPFQTFSTLPVAIEPDAPTSLAVDAKGNVYFLQSTNPALNPGFIPTLSVWNATTNQVTQLVSSGLIAPLGIAVDSLGNVYISDTGANQIDIWSPITRQLTSLVDANHPSGVNVDSQGNIYYIATINPSTDFVIKGNVDSLRFTGIVPSIAPASFVSVDPQGNIYIPDEFSPNSLLEFNSVSGVVSTAFNGLSQPYDAVADGQGNVYIDDFFEPNEVPYPTRIVKWSSATGSVVQTIVQNFQNGGNANALGGMALDSQGNLYYVNETLGSIYKVTFGWISVGTNSKTEPAAAGSDSVPVSVLPTNTQLSAVSDQSWLTVTSTANGKITYSFQGNTTLASRTAHISVLSQVIAVTQSANSPSAMTIAAGNSQSTPPGKAFATPLQVKVTDPNGNPVAGVTVLFNIKGGSNGATGTFPGPPGVGIGSASVTTGSDGIATAPTLTAGSLPGSLPVTATAGNLSVTFTLTILAPEIAAAPSSLLFEEVAGGTSAAQHITLSNIGTAPMSLTSIAITLNTVEFVETNNCGTTVAAGSSCTISVKFKALAAGSTAANVTITGNAVNSPVSVGLSGVGLPPTTITTIPTSLSFGNQAVGTPSKAQIVTLTDTGANPLTIVGVTIGGTNPGDFSQKYVCTSGVKNSCTISVVFTPKATGARTAYLLINDNVSGSPQKVPLTGTGVKAQ